MICENEGFQVYYGRNAIASRRIEKRENGPVRHAATKNTLFMVHDTSGRRRIDPIEDTASLLSLVL